MELFASFNTSKVSESGGQTSNGDEIDVIQNILIPPEVQVYGRAIATIEKQIKQIESDLDGKPQELLRQMLPIIQKILTEQITELEQKQQQFIKVESNQLNTFIINLEQQIVAVNDNIAAVQQSYLDTLIPQIKLELASIIETQIENYQQQN